MDKPRQRQPHTRAGVDGKAKQSTAGKLESKLVDVVIAAEHKIERVLTCLWDELPSWQQDNHFIRSGYRRASNSIYLSLKSLFYLHNESINIHTHLVGALASLALLAAHLTHTFLPRYPSFSPGDKLAFVCFFSGAVICLGASATYHTICNHSLEVAKLGNRLDYMGIVAMIAGSYMASLYYGFWCLPELHKTYCAMILLLGFLCTILTLHPHFRTPPYRPLRAAMYVLYGSSGAVPLFHAASILGWSSLSKQISLSWLLAQGALYAFGAVLYAARFPERLAPGKFDIFGSSHQWFHVLVLAAAGCELVGLVKAFDYRHGEVGMVCGI
ncbi:HlyIII-domain-containing protein [Terfezia boudieri ATCC MYA-4762]|uniref:HlyIII-domain-containing protein n=1 Tax=Terfezia boudieri ATCC MYA-4762 TaxID=1051890 RepID=A0A3N4LEA5_9PEZI|nr:HlyIII-domain-containing protein [Terfezia boudieri ATCC MYA-4762]